MRISISFDTTVSSASARPNKHALQGLIYKQLKESEFHTLHSHHHSKLFSFSDWFKDKHGNGYFMISSPNDDLIKYLESKFKDQVGNLVFLDYILKDVRRKSHSSTRFLKTASPIVLVRDSSTSEYYSFKKKTLSLQSFDEICKTSAVKKYRKFTGEEDFDFDGSLFDVFDLRREVPVRVDVRGKEFVVIGSTWNKLFLSRDKSRSKFYDWLADVGIGQKTSLGFGFLQPYKIGGKRRS